LVTSDDHSVRLKNGDYRMRANIIVRIGVAVGPAAGTARTCDCSALRDAASTGAARGLTLPPERLSSAGTAVGTRSRHG
jgi:hypothetical protein